MESSDSMGWGLVVKIRAHNINSSKDLLRPACAVLMLGVLSVATGACSNDNFSLDAKKDAASLSEPAPTEKADIVLIFDPSSSMADERAKLQSSFANLINQISVMDWRIGVMTTSAKGELLEIETLGAVANPSAAECFFMKPEAGKLWVDAQESSAIARALLTMQCGGAREKAKAENGIASIFNGLINYKASSTSSLKKMLRPDSHWVFIILSDEDEALTPDPSAPGKYKTGALPSQVLDFKATYKMPYKTFTVHSLVVPPGDEACLKRVTGTSFGTNQQAYGTRYAELTNATRGIVGSICAADYSTVLTDLGADLKKKVRATDLRCEPAPETLKIYLDGKSVSVPYRLEGTLLILEDQAPRGSYRFEFACKVTRI